MASVAVQKLIQNGADGKAVQTVKRSEKRW